MKKTQLLVFFFCIGLSFLSHAQPLKGTKFAKDGNGYYEIKTGEIILRQLPSLDEKVVITSKQLTPKNADKPLQVKNFFFSADEKKLLIYTNSKKVWRYETKGDYWVLNLSNNSLQQLGKSLPSASLMFAKFNNAATKVAYVSKHNLYVEDVATNKITALTKNGTDKLINGTFDWVYEEEFGCRDGFRWSADDKNIAFWQIDATKIKNYLMLNTTDSLYSFTVPVEYPKVGEAPSPYKIGVVNVATSQTKWMNIPGNPANSYLPRMEWANNNELIMEQMSRKQNVSTIFTCNAGTGIAKKIHEETSNAWIECKSYWNNDNPSGWDWINNGKEFLWVSEKSGYRKLYAISTDGKTERLIMQDNHDMIGFSGADEKNGWVYYTASPNSGIQQYLYKCKLDGSGSSQRVSPANQAGTHSYTISPNFTYAKHNFSNVNTVPVGNWVYLQTHQTTNPDLPTQNDGVVSNKVQFIKIKIEDNVELDAWMIKPKNFDSTKKYPVVFYVYSEPGAQTVSDSYGSANTFLYMGDMAADGYIQISVDGRGTPAPKGAAWRKAIYQKVGILNIADQAKAAKEVLKWSFVDADRVAVWGWSGGGSTTLNLMFQHPDIYKTGVAIAPVANRLSYDNIYEERYMGLPQENAEAYKTASAINHAKGLKGKLLVVHGTGDDNVHYQNTEMLINELVKNGKQFNLMSYPNRTHSISEGRGTFMHLAQLFTNFIKQNCPGGGK